MTETPARTEQRTVFIDHLRVLLTLLVIAHHTAITYGAEGGWYFHETGTPRWSNLLLLVFCTVNQAFFMGFFFLLAGYFTPPAYDRKGIYGFFRDRLIRLGIPLFVYSVAIGPLTIALAQMSNGKQFTDTLARLFNRGQIEVGPMWFVEALLIFSAAYAVLRLARPPQTPQSEPAAVPLPRGTSFVAAALVVALIAFAIRLEIPVGENVFGLQLGYFSSYIVLFAAGCAAWNGRRLERIDAQLERRWRRVTWVTLPVLFAYAIAAGALSGAKVDVRGGWNVASAIYALWEPFVAWGIILSLLWRFRARWNVKTSWSGRLTPCAYGAYIIHPPVVVALSFLAHDWPVPAIVKFLLVASGAGAISFAIGGLLLKLPGARRVL
jgi:peptidoglycan/LPS O-acetylase OafA/YrhL